MKTYTVKVALKGAPRIWRKIEIKGSQTLDDLHDAIFEAFDRFDEHLYAFFMSNKPWDDTSEYGLPYPDSEAKDATQTRIEALNLKPKQKFLYLFDFGDEWWHALEVVSINENAPRGKYPCIVESKGEAPPQYPDYEDEEDTEEEYEEEA